MSEAVKRKCGECVHALFLDHGYSNYTTEGTTFSCKIKAHPDGEFDQFYGEEAKLQFANVCPQFSPGESEAHQVDCPHDCICEGTIYEIKDESDTVEAPTS